MDKVLHFIGFKDLDSWSVKNYLSINIINSVFKLTALEQVIYPRQEKVKKNDYQNDIDLVKKISFNDGKIHLREQKKSGMDMYKVYPNDLLVSKINFHQGALAINNVNKKLLSSTHYQPYIINNNVDKKYLVLLLRSNTFKEYLSFIKSEGIKTETTYNFIKTLKIPLPSLKIQQQLVKNYQDKINLANKQKQLAKQKQQEIEEYLYTELGIQQTVETPKTDNILQFVNFKDLNYWSYEQLILNNNFSGKYKNSNFSDICNFKNKRFDKKDYKQDYFNYVDISSIDPLNGICKNKKIPLKNAPSRATQYINTGDLIIATTRPYLKKFAIVGNNFNNNICSSGFSVIEENSNKYNLFYIKEFLQSFYGIEQLKKHMTGGLYPAITIKKLKEIQIPLPPLAIQNKIVTHIENIKNEIKDLNHQAQQNKALALSEFEAEIFDAS
jgi:restriction endonuclease S subunit